MPIVLSRSIRAVRFAEEQVPVYIGVPGEAHRHEVDLVAGDGRAGVGGGRSARAVGVDETDPNPEPSQARHAAG